MKKICLFIVFILLLTGCFSSTKEESNFTVYTEMKENLMSQNEFDQTEDFKISLIYNPLDEGYRYDIVVNEPVIEMYDVKMLAYSNEDDGTICPNIGIFDYQKFHLIADYVDKENGYYKGIQLSGITNEVMPIKVYISYYTDIEMKNKVERYLEVYE